MPRGRVLVTGVEYTGGLAALRALRAGGFEPWAGVTRADSLGGRSRSAAGRVALPDPAQLPADWVAAVARAAEQLNLDVVLAGTDVELQTLSDNAGAFTTGVRIGAPPPAIVSLGLDKERVTALAVEAGISVPETMPVSAARLEEKPHGIRFPAVVKPLKSQLELAGEVRRFEVQRVGDLSELRAAVSALPGAEALVQPYIEGPLATVNGVAWEGALVASVHKRATRTWPPDCGPVCRAVTVPADAPLDAAMGELVGRIGWSGLFNAQFIEAHGRKYLIDFNPRPYHSLALAVASGANLPGIYTALLLGHPVGSSGYRRGIYFRSLDDVRATRSLIRSGEYGLAAREIVPAGRVVCPVFSLADPKPFLAAARRGAKGRAAQWVSNRRRRTRSAG